MNTPFQITINDQALRAQLARLGGAVNPTPLLKIAGQHMRGSIDRTFRDEGSPAGSWPRLAPSTIKKYGRKAQGHKLLIMSGRLKNSVTGDAAQTISGNTVRIGTNLVYAAVQQMGSGGGARSKVKIAAQQRRVRGRDRYESVLSPGSKKRRRKLIEKAFTLVREHERTAGGGIPARPYLVFRPEDPEAIARKMEAYIAKSVVEGTA